MRGPGCLVSRFAAVLRERFAGQDKWGGFARGGFALGAGSAGSSGFVVEASGFCLDGRLSLGLALLGSGFQIGLGGGLGLYRVGDGHGCTTAAAAAAASAPTLGAALFGGGF